MENQRLSLHEVRILYEIEQQLREEDGELAEWLEPPRPPEHPRRSAVGRALLVAALVGGAAVMTFAPLAGAAVCGGSLLAALTARLVRRRLPWRRSRD